MVRAETIPLQNQTFDTKPTTLEELLVFSPSAMKRRRASPPQGNKRKGGVRQRLAAQRRELDEKPHTSALAVLLLQLFSWGEASPQLCQRIASAAYEDAMMFYNTETDLRDLKVIGDIGCKGKWPNKCYQDLMLKMPLRVCIPLPTLSQLPFREPCSSLQQAFLLPHELFASIWSSYPSTWKKCVVPDEQVLESFWRHNENHPAFDAADFHGIPDFRRRCVPIGLHGDDVPITGVGKAWAQQQTVFSWSSLIATGETRDRQYFIYSCWEKLRSVDANQEKDTLGCFFKILVWSLKWLRLGLWPDSDWNNKKLLS